MANPYVDALNETNLSTGITGLIMRNFINDQKPTSQADALSKLENYAPGGNPGMTGLLKTEFSKPEYNLQGRLDRVEAQKPENVAARKQEKTLSDAGFSPTVRWNLPDYVEPAAYYVNPSQFDAKELPYNMVGVGATNYGIDLNNVTDRYQDIWETYGQYAEGVKPWSQSPIPESEAKMGGNKSIWEGMKDFLGPQGQTSRERYGPQAAAAYDNYLKTGQITDAMPAGMAFDGIDYGARYTGNKFQNKKGSIFDRFIAPALKIGATIINPYLGMATAATIGGIQGKPIGDIALDTAQAGASGYGANLVKGAGGFANLTAAEAAKLGAVTSANTLATGLRTDFDPTQTALTAATTSGGLSAAGGAISDAVGNVLPDAITNIPGQVGDALGNPIQSIRDALPDFMTGASNLPSNIPTDYFDLSNTVPDPLFPAGGTASNTLANAINPTGLVNNPFSNVPVGNNLLSNQAVSNAINPNFASQSIVPTSLMPSNLLEFPAVNTLFPEGGTADITLQNAMNPTGLQNNPFTYQEVPDETIDALYGQGQFGVNNPFADAPRYIEQFTGGPKSTLDNIKENPFEAAKLALGLAGDLLPDGKAADSASSGNPYSAPKAPAVTGRPRQDYLTGYTPMQMQPINYQSFYNPYARS